MSEPLTLETRQVLHEQWSDAAKHGYVMVTEHLTTLLALLDDLERAERKLTESERARENLSHLCDVLERERDEWRDVAKCEGENEAHERELVMRAEKAERERDEWAETARNEMAGRAAAEAGIRATLAERDEFCLDNDKHMAEVARLRDIISPGDAAAYEQGMAALQAKLAALEHDYAEAQDIAVQERLGRLNAQDRLARVVEALEHALEWLEEDGCDCGTDEPNTCALCYSKAALAAAKDKP